MILRGWKPRWFARHIDAQIIAGTPYRRVLSYGAWIVAAVLSLVLALLSAWVHLRVAPEKPDLAKTIIDGVKQLWEQRNVARLPDVPPAPERAPPASPLFAAAIGYSRYSPKFGLSLGLWLMYEVPFSGTFASAIEVELYIRITNLQSQPALITNLGFEIQNEAKQWIRLIRMDPRLGRLCFVPADERFAAHVIAAKSLDVRLDEKSIGPGDTVQGSAFLEYARDPSRYAKNPKIRITITDAVSHTWTKALTVGRLEGMDDSLQDRPGYVGVPNSRFDFSAVRRKRFSDQPRLK